MSDRAKTIVFLGPTLRWDIARRLCDAELRPPAAMGDITRAACEGPHTIVLIDGFFEDRPSVWHKEILWALSRGIAVVGASSMGALRAAELSGYGMAGYGKVFEAFVSGRLNDDDEVAVLHGPQELGWMPLTDAMVDIRDAMAKTVAAGILEADDAAFIVASAKREHFKCRSLETSIGDVLGRKRSESERRRIVDWFRSLKPGLKEQDCRGLLSNLDHVAAAARVEISQARKFIPTVYLKRLDEFGFSFPVKQDNKEYCHE